MKTAFWVFMISPEPPSSFTLHGPTHKNHLVLSFDSEAFSCLYDHAMFLVCLFLPMVIAQWHQVQQTSIHEDLSLPTAMSLICPWFLFSVLFSVLSCSLSLELVPVLGTSQKTLTNKMRGIEERFPQLSLTLWTRGCGGRQWRVSTSSNALPFLLWALVPWIFTTTP